MNPQARPTLIDRRGLRSGTAGGKLDRFLDVLGTLLAANRGTAQAANGSTWGRLLAPVLNVITRGGHWVLCPRWLQKRVKWGCEKSPLYLSNIAVVTKSAPVGDVVQPAPDA